MEAKRITLKKNPVLVTIIIVFVYVGTILLNTLKKQRKI